MPYCKNVTILECGKKQVDASILETDKEMMDCRSIFDIYSWDPDCSST